MNSFAVSCILRNCQLAIQQCKEIEGRNWRYQHNKDRVIVKDALNLSKFELEIIRATRSLRHCKKIGLELEDWEVPHNRMRVRIRDAIADYHKNKDKYDDTTHTESNKERYR